MTKTSIAMKKRRKSRRSKKRLRFILPLSWIMRRKKG